MPTSPNSRSAECPLALVRALPFRHEFRCRIPGLLRSRAPRGLAVSSYFSLKFPETLIGKKARLMEASFPSNYRAQANAHLGPERTLTQTKSLA